MMKHTEQIVVRCSEPMKAQLRQHSRQLGIDLSALVRKACEAFLTGQAGNGARN